MSRFEIKMPKLGESITEGTIVSWSVKVGGYHSGRRCSLRGKYGESQCGNTFTGSR